jgi:DNA polymerase-1
VFGTAGGFDKHERRSKAKMINYAVLYGKTPFTLAKDINVTPAVAQEFIDAYFGGFPRVRRFIDRTLETARRQGYVETMFGRRRMIPELNSKNGMVRSEAERKTVNFPIQGTAADILKRAMLRVHEALRGDKARMILTVHDELLIESPEHETAVVVERVREAMQGAAQLVVPLTVDVGIGPNWREAKS